MVSPQGGNGGGAGGALGSGGNAGSGVTGGNGGSTPAACAQGTAGLPWQPTPLTRQQYIHAASDLLGFDVRPLATFSDVGGRKFTPGVTMTALQVEERLTAAEAIAAATVMPARLAALLPCDPAALDDTCAAAFVDGFGQRAFRRPLDAGTKAHLRKLFDAGKAAGGAAGAVEWMVAGVLQAPDFLYQLATAPSGRAGTVVPLAPAALASRLSFFLWDSPPDADLLAAAGRGDLARAEGMAAQIDRMLRDARAYRALDDYWAHFLKLDELADISREAPEFTPALAEKLRASVLAGIAELYRARPTIDALLGEPSVHADGLIGRVYGLPAGPAGQDDKLTPGKPAPASAGASSPIPR